MPTVRISNAAQADIVAILRWSQSTFGQSARIRYQHLISAAIRDLADEGRSAGRTSRPELGPDVFSCHPRQSRAHSADVGRPRHLLICRMDQGVVVVGRVLHERMELRRHV